MASRSPAAPRSLADALRSWDDARLVALLRARPDLLTPVPPDLSTLAARCANRASVHRALDGLDTFTLQVVDSLAALADPASRTDLARLLGLRANALAPTLDRLRGLALLWGGDTSLRLVLAVRDSVGPHPAGLGPPAAQEPLPPAELDALLAGAPDGVRAVLARLTWGPPVGRFAQAHRPVDVRTARSPVEWLLAHRLLSVVDAEHVVLPREVGIHLRGGRVHAQVDRTPPAWHSTARTPAAVDAVAGSAAADVVRLAGEVGELWGLRPPPVLRAGGLGVRDLRRTASSLDVPESVAAFVIELCYLAGLIADDGEALPTWAPTPAFDSWAAEPPAARWRHLAQAWWHSSRAPGLVGSRDERGSPRAPLSDEVERVTAVGVRHDVVRELADLPPGESPDAASLLGRLRWRRPRRTGGLHEQLVRWTLAEAEVLGVTGRGALAGPGLALLQQPSRSAIDAAVAGLLPVPVDHVLLQADLTAVAPGPLEPALAQLMDLTADVESRGGATVFRFTADSVRRALDAWWSADALIAQLGAGSRTPVPQPLEFLVHDVARRHGRIRVGAVAAYVRSDDESMLREVLADRRSGPLGLRALAPTVLAAQADVSTVLEVLREMGLAPVAESAQGDLVLRRPDVRRTSPRAAPTPRRAEGAAPAAPVLEAVARALRVGSGDRQPPADGAPPLPPTEPASTLAALRDAIHARERVWIGYADGTGRVERRVIEPLTVEGGRVTALDHASDEVRTFSVHRVTGVARMSDPA